MPNGNQDFVAFRENSQKGRPRIEQYDFLEDQDFVSFHQNGGKPSGGRPTKEYAITLDMAKELAMVERNDKGKQARTYADVLMEFGLVRFEIQATRVDGMGG